MKDIEVRRIAAAEVLPLRRKVLRQGMPPETRSFRETRSRKRFIWVRCAIARSWASPRFSFVRILGSRRSARLAVARNGVDPALQSTAWDRRCCRRRSRFWVRSFAFATGFRPAILWCKARIKAVDFYRRNGWITVGEEFEIANFGPHYHMKWQPTIGAEVERMTRSGKT
jgi:hypothetical protein